MEKFVYQGQFIKVSEQEMHGAIWERAYIPSGVIVFPINEKKELLLVKEKRPHETPNIRLKPMAGILEPLKGNPEENAQRELQEELGFKAQHLNCFFTIHSSGTVNCTQYYFLALGLTPSKLPNPDGEDTILEIVKWPFDEIEERIYRDELKWSQSTLGLLRLVMMVKSGQLKLTP